MIAFSYLAAIAGFSVLAVWCLRYAGTRGGAAWFTRTRQVALGVAAGALCVASACFFFGANARAFWGTCPNVHLVPLILSGLFFGPLAGLAAGLSSAVGMWGVNGCSPGFVLPAETIFACAFAGVLSGLAGTCVFGGGVRRPVPVLLFACCVHLLASALALACRYFLESGRVAETFALDAAPSVAAVAAAAVSTAAFATGWGTWRSNFRRYEVYAMVVWLAGTTLIVCVLFRLAVGKQVRDMASNLADLDRSLENTLEEALHYTAESLADDYAKTPCRTPADVRALLERYNFDEINVYGPDGVIRASSDPDLVGVNMTVNTNSRAFVAVAQGKSRFVVQKFRRSVTKTKDMRKYFAVPAGPNLAIQVGYDWKRYEREIDRLFAPLFDLWSNVYPTRFACIRADIDAGIVRTFCEADLGVHGLKLRDVFSDFASLPNAAAANRYHAVFRGAQCLASHRTIGFTRLYFLCFTAPYFMYALYQASGMSFVLLAALFLFGRQFRRIAASNRQIARLRVAERRHLAEDLSTALAIQVAALPDTAHPYPDCLQIDLAAKASITRSLGGDFFDHAFLTAERLAVLVADVSGNGITAEMFMMRARTTLKSCLQTSSDIADAVAQANDLLAENNAMGATVALWVGVLDVRTGVLDYVSADCPAPGLLHADGTCEFLECDSGPVLGRSAGANYVNRQLVLGREDTLVLFSDGLVGRRNAAGNQFGSERLAAVLRSHAAIGVVDLCRAVLSAQTEFADGCGAEDDSLVLALRWRGDPEKRELSVPAAIENLPSVSAFAERNLKALGCPQDVFADIMVALDEVAANVAAHSGSEMMTVTFEFVGRPVLLRFTIEDRGRPFNPLADFCSWKRVDWENERLGGLGILLMKKLMDDIFYDGRDGCNRLIFVKQLPWRKSVADGEVRS